jgi:hypothetical protein
VAGDNQHRRTEDIERDWISDEIAAESKSERLVLYHHTPCQMKQDQWGNRESIIFKHSSIACDAKLNHF